VQAQPEPVVYEPTHGAISDRHLAILILGLVLGAACLVLAIQTLPLGFVVILILVLLYPGIGIWRTLGRDRRAAAPRLVLGPDALEAGGVLRIRWKDITEVTVRQPAGAKPGAPERVCIRVNRLAPVQPVPSTLGRLGLGGYDGYFDVTIPAAYGAPVAAIAAAMEERRARAAAVAAPPARPRARKRAAPPQEP
jgi:hypothetical protein